MENNYYKPEITEFRPLFEYEFLKNGEWINYKFRTDSKDKWKEAFNGKPPQNIDFDADKNLHRQIHKYIESGMIRVKYLDHDDIEGFGWERQKGKTHEFISKDGKFMLSFMPMKDETLVSIYCESADLGSNQSYEYYFRGLIINKSELKLTIYQTIGRKYAEQYLYNENGN